MQESNSNIEMNVPNLLENVTSLPLPESQLNPVLGKVHRFKFYGTASEYFGIWIVNILLTIITLSLYAPWAKVRRLRYFYANSDFLQRRFDFTGIPKRILYGRLIALAIYAVFYALVRYSTTAFFVGFVLIYMAVPWLMRATIIFNARNSKYANSRFHFAGTTKEAYIILLKNLAVIILTLGIFYPVAIWFYKRYQINNLYAGQLRFNLKADWSPYMSAVYVPIFIFAGIMFLIFVSVGLVVGISSFDSMEGLTGESVYVLVIGFYLAYFFGLLFIGPLISARLFMTTWNNTTLGNSVFKTDCNQWRYMWIVASNWIVKILSFGFMSAWAAIRLYRYQLDSLSLHLHDDPDMMMNMMQDDTSAIAEEISDIFDLDISL